jgi:transcriptional regulator with XRE-family HTH domain|tara:strand:+ start:479 stop:703 length:225 start_codon:yes stop_codon:yes gene_type:complete
MIDSDTRTNIRKIREIKGYSQEFMANELEISIKSYSRIECGETSLSVTRLKQIAAVFGVSISTLMEFDVKKFFV